jgi:two-component system, NtrC family, sensor kinase
MHKPITLVFFLMMLTKSFSQKADSATISLLSTRSIQLNADPGKNDSAIALAKICLQIAEKNQFFDWEAKSLILIGSELHDQDAAKQIFIKAINIAHQHNLPEIEVNGLYNISKNYDYQPDSCVLWEQKALKVAQDNKLKKWEINLMLTAVNAREGSFIKDSLENYFARGLALCHELNDLQDSLKFRFLYAVSVEAIGNYPKAFQRLLELSKYYEHLGDSSGMTRALYLLGRLFYNEQDFVQSVSYLHKSEITATQKDLYFLIFINTHFAGDYIGLGKKDSALFCATKAYGLAKQYYGQDINGGVLNDIGLVYFELGKDSIALSYLQRSFANLSHRGEVTNICETGLGLAKVFKKAGKQDSSIYYARLTLSIAKKLGFLNYISEASTLLAAYFKTRNIDSAFYFQQIGIAAYDSLYLQTKEKQFQNIRFTNQQNEQDIATAKETARFQYRNNLRIYGLIAAMLVFLLVAVIFYRNNIHKQKALALIQKQKQETDVQKAKVEKALEELKSAQAQLIQSEKMASLGELTAGIAHEIQNPLNFVNNFSEVNKELLFEMKDEMSKGNINDATSIANDVIENSEKINHHGRRADAIVKGMLQHSRSSSGQQELADINALADEYLRLAYHGLRAKDKEFNVTMKTDFDSGVGKINIIPQDIGRVLLNLYNNAFYAVSEKAKRHPEGYAPTVSVSTKKVVDKIEIMVEDNGNGISEKVVDKIFQPFFTTKPTGQGTGLGLSLGYDIVKAHGGEISVKTKEGAFTALMIQLPLDRL